MLYNIWFNEFLERSNYLLIENLNIIPVFEMFDAYYVPKHHSNDVKSVMECEKTNRRHPGLEIEQLISMVFNPYFTNEFSHHYQLSESTFIFRGVRSDF